MRRHDVPEEGVALYPELVEHRLDNGRGRFGGTGTGELALGRQGDAGDPRPSVTGRLCDQEKRCVLPFAEVPLQSVATQRRARVLVEGVADPGRSEPADEARRHGTSLVGVQRRRVVVQGHVQGVFFRETTRRRALTEGIAGWVRNQPDGSVEAVLEGEREAVERLVAFLREGPRGARVDWVDVVSEEAEGLDGFDVR